MVENAFEELEKSRGVMKMFNADETFLTEEKILETVSRQLSDELNELNLQIEIISGAEKLLFEVIGNLDVNIQREKLGSPFSEYTLKLNALHELIKSTVRKLHDHENKASENSSDVFKYFRKMVTSEHPKDEIIQEENNTIYYMKVESHYDKLHVAKSKEDAIMFSVGRELEDKHELDSIVLSSVEDARAFALAILNLCVDIERVPYI